MKTINDQMSIHYTLKSAKAAFSKCKEPCMLLSSKYGTYFVDRSKQAIVDWPKLYTLIIEK